MVQRGGLVIIVIAGMALGAVMLALLALVWSLSIYRHMNGHPVPEPVGTVSHPYSPVPKPFTTPARCNTFRLVGPNRPVSSGGYVKARMICPGQAASVHPPVPPNEPVPLNGMPTLLQTPSQIANSVHMPTPRKLTW